MYTKNAFYSKLYFDRFYYEEKRITIKDSMWSGKELIFNALKSNTFV